MMKRVICKPLFTEKGSLMAAENKYLFEVKPDANKIEIRKEVELLFNVKVLSVNVVNLKSKVKRLGRFVGKTSARRKAIVKLDSNSRISNFEKLK